MRRGFTIFELMIVVALIAFLSTLALPNYLKYLARAKRAEVALNLSALYMAEQIYWSEQGTYSTNLKEIGFEPAGAATKNFSYTYGFNVPSKTEGTNFFIGKLMTPAEKLAAGSASKKGFKASAAADLLGNGKIDVWTIDENRNLVHVVNGLE